jgi:pimeloyl-ACP methyl ester carboxylesterase
LTNHAQSGAIRRASCLHQGCWLAYQIQGSGPPAIFIQGLSVHGSAWAPQINALAAHYECLSFDNRGLGRSQPLGARLTIQQMAEDTLALMDAQSWPSAHVIGHSMGGLIALHIALSAPERVRSLSLLCSFPRGRDAAQLTPAMLWTWIRVSVGTRAQRRNAFLGIVMPPAALAASNRAILASELAPLFGHDLADLPPVSIKQLLALVRYDATPRLPELARVPTLVVSAAQDRVARPAVGRALAAAIPGARFIEIPNAAHGVGIQHAERINALLREHLG